MKIVGIAAKLPSKVVTNEDVIDLIDFHSKDNFDGNLSETLRKVKKLLEKNGVKTRRWLADNESPMGILKEVFEKALNQAGIERGQIDLLIYPNVSRGFTEPANSSFITKALGLSCRNYDVVDACMGWVTAMDAVNNAMLANRVRYAVIVNMEFLTIKEGPIFPKNFCLKSDLELAYKFPSYTMGEAVSVTILSNDASDNFIFNFVSRPDLSNLCTISLPGWQNFCEDSDIENIKATGGGYQFSSYSSELHSLGAKDATSFFKGKDSIVIEDFDHVFTHTSSIKQWSHYAELIGLSKKVHHIADKVGNIITASIPVGLVDAAEKGILKKGDACLGWNASAGMVFSTMKFNF